MTNTSLSISLISYFTGLAFLLLSIQTGLSINNYHSPIASFQNGVNEHGNALTEHVVIILVDGLRHDVSLKMPFLNSLRSNGSDFISWTDLPSLSYPGWSTLLTGATPEISGKLLNWNGSALEAEHLFSITKEQGLKNAVVGCSDWWRLLGDNIIAGEQVESNGDCIDSDAQVQQAALRVLSSQPVLTLIHFLSVDEAGHRYGGASSQYLERAQEVDTYIREIASSIDFNTTTLIVTSDHGHRDAGGHGGEEILARKSFAVFYGKGIKRASGEIRQIDICPTISNLLGLKITSLAQGRILFESLNQSEGNEAVYAYLLMKQRYLFALKYTAALGKQQELDVNFINLAYEEIMAGNFSKAIEISQQGLNDYNQKIENARNERIAEQRMLAATFSFLSLLISIWISWLLIRREKIKAKEILKALIIALLSLSLYFAIFLMLGMNFTFSVFNESSDVIKAILTSFFVPGFVVTAMLVLWYRIEKKQRNNFWVRKQGVMLYGIFLISFTFIITVNGILYGFFFTDFVVHIDAFMWVFLSGFISAGVLTYLGASLQMLECLAKRAEANANG